MNTLTKLVLIGAILIVIGCSDDKAGRENQDDKAGRENQAAEVSSSEKPEWMMLEQNVIHNRDYSSE